MVALFTALAIASDFALTYALDVKVDPIVFSVTFIFGLEMGVYVGVLSELIWGTFNPFGFGGAIIPFLVAGEILYSVAGWAAARVWASEREIPGLGSQPLLWRPTWRVRLPLGVGDECRDPDHFFLAEINGSESAGHIRIGNTFHAGP